MTTDASGDRKLTVLAVDDEAPALSELVYLLRQDPHIGTVLSADSGAEALRQLGLHTIDGIFMDIRMPGLSGVELATVLAQFRNPPPIVFVTAFDSHAVDAFELKAVDYVLKPARPERLAEAVRRLVARVNSANAPAAPAPAATPATPDDETIPVELGGVTRFISRSDVRYVESHGDYARLHTSDATHLVRVPMATLEERWRDAGFIRIHRSYLVSLAHVTEVRLATGRSSVVLGNEELTVSRRHTRDLREVLVRRSRPTSSSAGSSGSGSSGSVGSAAAANNTSTERPEARG
ncbi:LytR/AlgR family response regulator transcription factor [Sporichthya polymorpha]|uniref:LytR/AlgR family response regulator transcription factor n=1 Tax=Sporichthya polymorpha TaxID=35751 RepID=UPI0003773C67|nr:LytTR family DNA-binding domain-containing protein [Sporichthya polymorpha]